MAHKRPTPEEELLNLIEKGDAGKFQKTENKKRTVIACSFLLRNNPYLILRAGDGRVKIGTRVGTSIPTSKN